MEHLQKKVSRNPVAKTSATPQQDEVQTPAFQFKDHRPVATVQRNIQSLADQTTIQKKNTTGMPDKLKAGVENLSGMDMSDVKVHYNSSQPAQLNAHAYAQGTNIHIAPGQEKHLPHEAWHVVQQKQGRVKPTTQMKKGVAINDDKGLEKEADVMGAKALNTVQLVKVSNKVFGYDSARLHSESILQMIKYEKKITVPANFDPNNWPAALSVGGGKANSSIAKNVNDTLVDMGWPPDLLMSAHMIPNRLGGAGDNTNVRPWSKSFETNLWENSMEKPFNEVMTQMPVGSSFNYTVETSDLTAIEAGKIAANADYVKNSPAYNAAILRLVKIPKGVKTSIGGLGVLNTTGCWPSQISEIKP